MNAAQDSSVRGLPWWLWMSVGHLFFVACLYILIERVGIWNVHALQHFSLARENNLAVWWAGFCLLLSGLCFYRLGCIGRITMPDRIMWLSLSAMALGLCLDEIGSLHERISLVGGWWALAPFGAVGGGVFLYAVARCLLRREHMASGLSILAGLLIFVAVAGLEHLEHLETGWSDRFSMLSRFRLVLEEGIELVGSFCLVLAAVLALARNTRMSWRDVSIVMDPLRLTAVQELLFIGLFLHLGVTILAMPYLSDPGRGNPAYWYPNLVFVLCAFHCMHRYSRDEGLLWALGVVLFVCLAVGQMQNIGVLIYESFGRSANDWVTGFYPAAAWTLAPALAFLSTRVSKKWVLIHGLLALGVMVMLRNGTDFFEAYYILSGIFALQCFNLLARSDEARD